LKPAPTRCYCGHRKEEDEEYKMKNTINKCAALVEKMNGRDGFGNLDVDGVIILKWILTNECKKTEHVFVWLRSIPEAGFSG
jgi:hypothetical protein